MEAEAEGLESRRQCGNAATRQTAKDSIYTMASIVTMYLLGNFANLFITIIEHVDGNFLYLPSVMPFYNVIADLISFFTVCTCAFRLPLYMIANRVPFLSFLPPFVGGVEDAGEAEGDSAGGGEDAGRRLLRGADPADAQVHAEVGLQSDGAGRAGLHLPTRPRARLPLP